MAFVATSEEPRGYWNYTQARYLGVEFQIKGKTHFGWARFKNSSALWCHA